MPDLVGSFLNLSAMHQQTAAAERMADKQNKENERMWRMNNAYNAPAAQMQRYKDAGLNPALVYGQMPQANAPDMVGGSPAAPASSVAGDTISDLANLRLLEAQKRNIDADTQQKLSDAGLKDAERDNAKQQWFLIDSQTNTEYQKGLSIALDNWLKGYRPEGYKSDDGSIAYSANSFGRELDNARDGLNKAYDNIKDRFKLDEYDRKYMDRLFAAMCSHDETLFDYETSQMKSNMEPLRYMSEHEWAQFVNYIVQQLAPIARDVSYSYRQFRGRN